MVIYLKNHISIGNSSSDGDVIFSLLLEEMKHSENIEVSFKDMNAVSSSFINSAFIKLLDFYSFEDIKKKLTFTDTMKIHNKYLKERFEFESKRALAIC